MKKVLNEKSIVISGEAEFLAYDKNGKLKGRRFVRNLVVDEGEKHIANRLFATPTQEAMSHHAIGSGTTAPAYDNTALETQYGSRVVFDTGYPQQGTAANIVEYKTTFNITSTITISEAGIFNAATDGVMLARVTFTGIVLESGDTLVVKHRITIGTLES